MTQKSGSVTIRDVAREAGVSVATVSRYLNHNAPVSPEVSERLDRVMQKFQYVPHAAARQLATRKSCIIGLLLTNMHNNFFGPLLNGIESVLREKGYNLIVSTYRASNQNTDSQPPIGPQNVDGLLIFADTLDDQQIARLYEKKFPIVLIHRGPPKSLPIPYVTVENKNAVRKLIDHLIEVHGRRRIILFLGPANQEDSHWRERGYKASLKSHGIPFDRRLILCGEFSLEIAYQALMEFLAAPHPDFDAIFSGDDEAAVGVLMALQEAGYRIPEQVSLAGFNDEKLSAFLNPSLTTVRAPTEMVGRTAGEQMLNILQGRSPDPATVFPTDIVIRRSCGCVV